MRMAWKVRRRWDGGHGDARGAGIAPRTISASSTVVAMDGPRRSPARSWREALVAVAAQHRDELGDGVVVDDLGGTERLIPIHPHVEGAVVTEGEAALGLIELGGAHAEVEEDRREAADAERVEGLGQVGEATASDPRTVAERRNGNGGSVDRQLIPVDADEVEVAMGGEHGSGVPPATDGRVEDGPCRRRGEQLDDLGHHDRLVLEGCGGSVVVHRRSAIGSRRERSSSAHIGSPPGDLGPTGCLSREGKDGKRAE